jgi:putative SOS response-associated peptidase YedK
MCGRAANHAEAETIIKQYQLTGSLDGYIPSYNIAPTQSALCIIQDPSGLRQAAMLHWGLIPFWAKDPSIGQKMINARSESVQSKPAYRQAFERSRCVIPVTGFYEWQSTGEKNKRPFFIRLKSDELMSLAGIWDSWTNSDGVIRSFSILTTQANSVVKPIHHRMPVILDAAGVDKWLEHSGFKADSLLSLLSPFPDEALTAYQVSTLVNSPKNDGPVCIEPVR